MSEKADTGGPATRRRRTTVSGVKQQQANGSKWHDAGAKPPRCSAKTKAEASRPVGPDGEAGTKQEELPHSPKKARSAAEDITDTLRYDQTRAMSGYDRWVLKKHQSAATVNRYHRKLGRRCPKTFSVFPLNYSICSIKCYIYE